MKKNPKGFFKYWGIYCWHAFSTNPKKIELQISEDNEYYYSLGNYELRMKPGKQFFTIDKNGYKNVKKVNYIRIIIKETFGESRTYLNQIFFFDETADLEGENQKKKESEEKNIDGQSFFNSDNFKEDEETSYEPVAPMQKVPKLISSENEDEVYSNKMEELVQEDLENEEENEINSEGEEKEKKLRKIEKILKSKIKNPTQNRNTKTTKNKFSSYQNKINSNTYEDQEEVGNLEQYLSENTINSGQKQNTTISYMKRPQISSRLATRGKNLFFSNNSTITHNNYTDANFRERSHTPNSTSHTTIPYRTLTPLRQVSKQLYCSPQTDDRLPCGQSCDPEYMRLENQLREMEEHLKFMNVEATIDSAKNMIHSKSFSFLPKDTINSNPQTIVSNNTNNNNQNIIQYIKEDSNNNAHNDFPLQSDSRSDFKTILLPSTRIDQFTPLSGLPLIGKKTDDQFDVDKIKSLEKRIQSLEVDIRDIKLNFEEFSKDIKTFIASVPPQQKESTFNNNNNTEQMMSIILKECAKMINSKFNEYNSQYQQGGFANPPLSNNNFQYTGGNNISTDSNINSFEARLNKKIEEKFDILANNIENQVYKDFLQPSINAIENRMKENLDEIKEKLSNLNNNNNLNSQSENTRFIDSYRMNRSIRSSMNDVGKSTQRRNDKFDEINKIGEKLYDKLVEKEKKLKDLKNETTNYLKKKLKNDEKRYSNTTTTN